MYSLFVKEIRAFLSSRLAIVVALAFQLLSVWFLWISPFSNTIVSAGVADWYPFLAWIPLPLLFVCAVLSLQAFAEEKQQGTFETLFSLPIASVQIVLAKYYAAILCLLFMLIPSLFQLLLIAYLSTSTIPPDFGVFVISFVGIFLCGSSYISLGMFTSLYTKNIWIAFLFSLLIMGFFAQSVIGNWGVNAHLLSFNRGVLAFDDVVYFLNIIMITLVLITFKLKPKVVK